MNILMWSIIGLALAALVFLLINCSSKRNEEVKADLTEILDSLQKEDFFQYVPNEKIETLKQLIIKQGFLFPPDLGRYYSADAEDLAEQGVMDFIMEISPFLQKQNIRIPLRQEKGKKLKTRNPKTGEIVEMERTQWIVDESLPDDPAHPYLKPVREELPESGEYFTVTLGEFTQEIWNKKMSSTQYWEAGMCHTFLLINKILEKAKSHERIYGIAGGNEGGAVFLTQRQFEIIRNSSAIKDFDMPWEPYEVK